MTIKVTIDELESIFKRLVQKAREDGIEFVNIESDYYWIIFSDEWDNFSSSPEPSVGSLIDDWNSLQGISKTNRIVTYLDYERLASILRALSETITPSK